MSALYPWQKSYLAALLETDGTRLQELLQVAESEIHERERVLSEDHGGTADERQAIADAMSGMTSLRKEAAGWQSRHVSKQ